MGARVQPRPLDDDIAVRIVDEVEVVAGAAAQLVGAGAAVERVVAAAPGEFIVAGTTKHDVGGCVAVKCIAVCRADQVLDPAQAVARSVTATG